LQKYETLWIKEIWERENYNGTNKKSSKFPSGTEALSTQTKN